MNGIEVKWVSNEEELVSFIKSGFPKAHFNKVCIDLPEIPADLTDSNNLIKSISVEDLENNIESADYLITKANFGLVDTGSVVLFNHRCKNCFNKVDHVILILDINNLIVKSSDLGIIMSLYKREMIYGKQQAIDIISHPFNKIISNNYQFDQGENYSTQKVNVTVVLYDNGITALLDNARLRETLYCINCGNCKSVCPVYQINHKYTPIELIKNNAFATHRRTADVFENTTLCGNCDKVCPVLIPLMNLFITEMETVTNNDHDDNWRDFGKTLSKRLKLNKLNGKFRRYFFLRKLFNNNKKLLNYFMSQQDDFYNLTNTKAEENAKL
ncbi:MAG: lactate utilization protein [Bacteroidales bacterium]|nr:lactate utilization protein [Bacteroidales bacterium]